MRTGKGNRLTKAGKRRLKCYNTCICKKRYRKRKSKRIKKIKIICDTNIWYGLGNGSIVFAEQGPKVSLIPTYIVIDELIHSKYSISNLPYLREGIKAVKKKRSNLLLYPPMIFLLKLMDKTFEYNAQAIHGNILKAIERFANGGEVKIEKANDFEAYLELRKSGLIEYCNAVNTNAPELRKKISDRKKYRLRDNSHEIKGLINDFIEESRYSNFKIPEGFDWSKVELFIKTFGQLIKDILTTERKLEANDLFDVFQLVYVKPGQRFWTKDIRLKRLIIESGLDHYLFDEYL